MATIPRNRFTCDIREHFSLGLSCDSCCCLPLRAGGQQKGLKLQINHSFHRFPFRSSDHVHPSFVYFCLHKRVHFSTDQQRQIH